MPNSSVLSRPSRISFNESTMPGMRITCSQTGKQYPGRYTSISAFVSTAAEVPAVKDTEASLDDVTMLRSNPCESAQS